MDHTQFFHTANNVTNQKGLCQPKHAQDYCSA